jgi:hypothetical protein
MSELFERVLSLRERMAKGQVREIFETSSCFPSPEHGKERRALPSPKGRGLA